MRMAFGTHHFEMTVPAPPFHRLQFNGRWEHYLDAAVRPAKRERQTGRLGIRKPLEYLSDNSVLARKPPEGFLLR